MKTRNFVFGALGLAAAITFGGAATASAQARSDTRIPVRKDAPMETRAHVDTIRLPGRVDTVMVRGRTDTVRLSVDRVRYDTTWIRPAIMPLPNMFFGLGGGVAIPMNNWRNSTKDGPSVHGHIGYFPGSSMFGIRLDGDAGFLSNRDSDRGCGGVSCPKPKVYSGTLNLLARFPLDRTSKLNPVLYALGGGGIDKFSNFIAYQTTGGVVTAGSDTKVPYTAGPPPGVTGANIAVTTANRQSKSLFFHGNAGGGLEFNVGPARMFVESKYMIINTLLVRPTGTNTSGGRSHYWPTVAGFNFGW